MNQNVHVLAIEKNTKESKIIEQWTGILLPNKVCFCQDMSTLPRSEPIVLHVS